MILADTNILSTFARIHQIALLFEVAETQVIYLAPAVIRELKTGIQKGLSFLTSIFDTATPDRKFESLQLTPDEKNYIATLPGSLNAGEKESIAICAIRKQCKLLTNDKRAHNFCKSNNIPSLDLKLILRQLWKAGHCTKNKIRSLMKEIEKKEPGMVIKGKDEILR